MNIVITDLTEAQELAIKDMLFQWKVLSAVGSSRWVCFYADGDGNFRPSILVDGFQPQPFGTPEEVNKRWREDEYRMDFDEIAWKLRGKEDV